MPIKAQLITEIIQVLEHMLTELEVTTKKLLEVLSLLEKQPIQVDGQALIIKLLEVHQDILQVQQQDLVLEDLENKSFGIH